MTLMTSSAGATTSRRLVVVVGSAEDPRVHDELALLAQAKRALDERDVVVQSLTPEAARRDRVELGVAASATFEVLLVGKDGGVKLRRQKLVTPAEIAALIDTMPMRREEMIR